ncbi:hypothetical protein PKHYL_38300 [Psychrobacter sp. KH172YL61]|uniref:amidohydrolase family protein n=1 Tax=Psychrobacter sp. KH172YL61 TaxID=2517899 RepID=UPI0010B9C9E1|nr:amidohydrolase family protein [Psychrobacter sp. KH172YL61]BBI69639.1 hypothetical protein PKHYL_38300 [Psychrobacter sp. KH172YL61]
MIINNAKLRGKQGLHSIECENGRFVSIIEQDGLVIPLESSLDAKMNLLSAPFVEPHIHLDAVFTVGEPNWNLSGTLFEGIERWAERKPMLTSEDVQRRVLKAVQLLVENGVQHIRTHVDITDPELVALKAIVALKEKLSAYIDLQIVAFPQEGILSFPNGKQLMEKHLNKVLMSSVVFLILNILENMGLSRCDGSSTLQKSMES